MRILLLLACFSFNHSLVAAPINTGLLEGVIGSYQLTLDNNTPYCGLLINSSDSSEQLFSLNSKSPCYFFADNLQKNIQTYSYPKSNIDYVALIGGTAVRLDAETRLEKKLSADNYCTESIQAITLEENKIKLTQVEDNAFACAKDRLDEKRYQQVIKQKRFTIKELEQQKIKEEGAGMSFFEGVQQKIEAIFTKKENK
jgi:hypothetical protein